MELLGLLLGILGLVFAFQPPRTWLISLFHKSVTVEHTLGVRLHSETHNDGKPLDSSGRNISHRFRVFYWNIRNLSDFAIQIERGVILRQRNKAIPIITLQLPQCTNQLSLMPKHRLELLEVILTNSEIEHLRHWIREGEAIGVRSTDGIEHWVPDSQYVQLREALQQAAAEAGLSSEIQPGQPVTLRFGPEETFNKDGSSNSANNV